jgi:hypothetical protein
VGASQGQVQGELPVAVRFAGRPAVLLEEVPENGRRGPSRRTRRSVRGRGQVERQVSPEVPDADRPRVLPDEQLGRG